ncbi:sialate O-acetylesterase [Edaphobacter modestus]|uniref:Sialate O-acetylesterase n=1 Tax=Edaphobacter modestus TaxID=388466 RepID=A0A4Q7YVV6_9BACT|nr:sialate O-acetylesterase [Edaphobacter modestus]RZU41504.1 sialate O-acetylesterase [Edaphobacter modestus]
MNLRYLLILFATAISVTAHAEVALPKIFSSHMVLQRDMPVHIWGTALPGEQVAVSFHGSSVSATADRAGRWSVYLPPQLAGGPFSLTVRAANTVQLDDIFLGDLWFASGQSNMEMPLAGFSGADLKDSEKEIAAANHPEIRLLHVAQDTSDYPLEDVKGATGWSICTPETARTFSAAAYFFARDLQQHQKVAIGLIDSTWGGTPAEAWVSLTGIAADSSLMPVFAARADRMDRESSERRLDQIDKRAKLEGKGSTSPRPWHPDPASWQPAALFNAMVAPFTPLPIRGVIWYQGESNSKLNTVELYNRLFSSLIQDWRRQWRQGDFPFLFVQISAYASTPQENWGLLRDAQRRTLSLANTGMAVTIDSGDEHNVHPAKKQIVGERLSLLARKMVYGEQVAASGPLFRLAYPEGGAMHVWFNNAEGLTAQGAPEGFEVAGADGNFVAAKARIEGDTVVASSPSVPEPRYVRYAWPNFPSANLYNAAGLPASTFTSYPVP